MKYHKKKKIGYKKLILPLMGPASLKIISKNEQNLTKPCLGWRSSHAQGARSEPLQEVRLARPLHCLAWILRNRTHLCALWQGMRQHGCRNPQIFGTSPFAPADFEAFSTIYVHPLILRPRALLYRTDCTRRSQFLTPNECPARECVNTAHCFVSSNSFHGQITQKAVH